MDDSAVDYQPVTSSNLVAVGFDPTFGRLWVKFKGGSVYAYDHVPRTVYEEFLAAGSKGEFLFRVIRAGGTDSVYAYQKVR